MRSVWLLVIAGCGRLNFAPLSEDLSPDGPTDGTPDSDAPVDIGDGPTIQTVEFGDRPSTNHPGTIVETWLDDGPPDRNYGADQTMICQGSAFRPILLRIDLSSLPSGATVTNTKLTLQTNANAFPAGQFVRLHRMLEAWDEGDLVNATGEASFNRPKTGQLWASAMANPSNGLPSSRDDLVQAEFQPSISDTDFDVELPSALVQSWVDNPSTNFGVMFECLDGGSNNVAFHASEASIPDKRPRFIVAFQ